MERRQRAEDQAFWCRRALMMIRASNHALLHAAGEQELLDAICNAIVQAGGYRFAWIGEVQEDHIVPRAKAGYEMGFLDEVTFPLTADPDETSMAARAVLTQRTITIGDMDLAEVAPRLREEAARRGYRSLLALPLVLGDEGPFGVLCIFDGRPAAFDPDELSLMEEFAADLTFGVLALRERSAKQRVEADLRVARERLGTVVGTAPIILWAMDRDGVYTLSEGKGLEALGLEPGQVVGRSAFELYADRPEVLEHLRRALEGQASEVTAFAGDRAFKVCCAPLYDGAGDLVGAQGLHIDVTGEHEAAQAKARAEELLRLDRFRSRFVSIAAHELNQPLTPLNLQVGLLRSGRIGPLSERQAKAVKVLDRNIRRLGFLVSDMLDSARLQAGRLALRPKDCDLEDVIATVADTYEDLAEEQGLVLDLEVEGPLRVKGDRQRLVQVVSNLVNNAIKFTEAGGSIAIRARRDGGRVVVVVQDTGIGLEPGQIDALFEPFHQVHEEAPRGAGGAGLGLYLSRGIVEAHGGAIEVESGGAGKGSTFRVMLPAADRKGGAERSPKG